VKSCRHPDTRVGARLDRCLRVQAISYVKLDHQPTNQHVNPPTHITMISSFADPIPISSSTYQTTSSGNLISVRARIYGATAIVLHGRNVVEQGVILRGDLRRFLGSSSSAAGSKKESDGQMAIVMGRYCRIGEDSVVRPPGKMTKG
jgi:hypothetical protein